MNDLEKFITKCEKNGKPYDKINLTDAPELTDADFENGYFKYFRPPKKTVTIRLDIDNLHWLQSVGKKDYQTRLNGALRWARLNDCPIANI